jgi:hypothetical protein
MNRLMTFVLLGLLSLSSRAAAQPVEVPMTADRWEALVGKFEIKEHRGTQALVEARSR